MTIPAPDAPAGDETLAAGQLAPADHGRLADATRRAIIALVRGPYLHGVQQPDLWRALLRDRTAVERHLGNMYLDLVVDTERQVAFCRNAELGIETPRVVRSVRLGLLDTALVLELRRRLLHDVDVTGRVHVSRADLLEALEAYRPAATTNLAAHARAAAAAVEKMRKANLLLVTAEPDRYEVSPVLAVVLDADEVAATTAELVALAEGGTDSLDGYEGLDDDEDGADEDGADEPADDTSDEEGQR